MPVELLNFDLLVYLLNIYLLG